MALESYGPRATYLTLADGAVVRRFKQQDEDPQAEPRTTKSGTVVFERKYPAVVGYITGIQIGSSTFEGKTIEKAQWKVTIVDDGQTYILTMPYSSAYAKRLINALASVTDFGQPLRLLPWRMENDQKPGKYWLGVTVYTRPFTKESKVPVRYAKEDIPPMKEVRLKGQVQWDDEEQMAFWENVVETIITPRIKEASGAAAFDAIAKENGSTVASDDDGDAFEPIITDGSDANDPGELPF